jgi:hypothetical protein
MIAIDCLKVEEKKKFIHPHFATTKAKVHAEFHCLIEQAPPEN